MIIKEENFKWHLEAFASELFIHLGINLECTALLNVILLSHVPVK